MKLYLLCDSRCGECKKEPEDLESDESGSNRKSKRTAAQKAHQLHRTMRMVTPPVTDTSMTGVSNLDAPLPMRAQHGGYTGRSV